MLELARGGEGGYLVVQPLQDRIDDDVVGAVAKPVQPTGRGFSSLAMLQVRDDDWPLAVQQAVGDLPIVVRFL